MTLAIDTSALVRRYVADPGRELVLSAMAEAEAWCVSEILRPELMMLLHRCAISAAHDDELHALANRDWEHLTVVPVDDKCLSRAVEIGSTYRVRLVDAIHLAAADRLPHPIKYLTFDRRQIPAAAALGFQVLAPSA